MHNLGQLGLVGVGALASGQALVSLAEGNRPRAARRHDPSFSRLLCQLPCIMRCLLLQVPVKQMSAFTASKCAVAGLAEAIRAEVEPLGLHIGQVYPGLVKSNFMERAEFYGQSSDEERKAFRQQVGWALNASNTG